MNKKRSRLYYLIELNKYIKYFKTKFIIAVIVHFIYKALPILISFLVSYMISKAIGGNLKDVGYYFIWVLSLTLMDALFYYLDIFVSHEMAYYILTQLRNAAYEKVDEIAPSGVQNMQTGDLISIIMDDIEILEWFYAHTIGQLIVAVLLPFLALLAIAYFSWWLVISILPFIIALVLVPIVTSKKSNEQGRALRQEMGVLNAKIVDGIQGLMDTISFNFQKEYFINIFTEQDKFNSASLNYAKRSSGENTIIQALIAIASLTSQLVTIILISRSKLDIFWMIPMFSLTSLIYGPILETIMLSRNYGMIFGAAERIFKLLQKESLVKDQGKLCYRSEKSYDLEFKDAVFSYKTDGEALKVLNGISFSLKTGETLALVGASGSGKSTIAKLIDRFWDLDQGQIKISGQDIRDYKIEELRKIVTIVPQEIYLFNRTIEENIRLAKEDASFEELAKAVEKAQIIDILEKLEDGLDTNVGERALKLSGGEKARLALAQAFLKDSPILVLDEATANLDSENERKINQAINKLKLGKACLIIAHRLSTIRSADKIIMLKNGKICTSGTYEELENKSEDFRKLIGSEYS